MRFGLRLACVMCPALLWMATASAQQDTLLANRDALALCDRVVQLMDSTRVVIPEMARAGEPLAENARQALATMRAGAQQNSTLVYTFTWNLRAYLALADAVPKPYPFPEAASKQLAELRDAEDRLASHLRALLASKEAQLLSPDRDNLQRYSDENLKVGPPQATKPRVVFLGDSITDMWRLNEYFPSDRDFVNRGISGQITGQMLARMQADVIDLKPSVIVVLAGTNDIARGAQLKTIEDNLTMIAELAEYAKIKPVFASLLPVSDYHKDQDPQYEQTKRRPPQTIQALNSWLTKFCRDHNYPYLDYHSQLVDPSGFLKTDLSDDGLHPNAKGYRVMAPVALAALDKILKPTPEQKKRRFPFFGGQ